MILDKEDHRMMLLEMIKTSSILGRFLDVVLELRKAIETAKIEKKKEK